MKYYKDGRAVIESTGEESETKARRKLDRFITALAQGDWLSPQQRAIPFKELWDKLSEDFKINGQDVKRLEYQWKRIGPEFGHLKANQITTDKLNAYILQHREAGLENATLNRDMASMKRAFTLAYKCTPRKIHTMPVFPKRLTEAAPRKGFVEQPTFDKLTKAAESLWMRSLLATAYAFGFRKSELLEMKVAQVNLIDKTITLYRGETKSGEPRLVAMTQDVYLLLTECVRGKDQDDFVFTRDGERVKDMRDAWEKLTTAAGCPELLLHDLRRSAVRNMIRRGIPERVAMQISGHKTRSVFDRYNIVSQNDLVEAARKIEAGQKTVSPSPNEFRYSSAKVGPSYNA